MIELVTSYTDPAEVNLGKLPVESHVYRPEYPDALGPFVDTEMRRLARKQRRTGQTLAMVAHAHKKGEKCDGHYHGVWA